MKLNRGIILRFMREALGEFPKYDEHSMYDYPRYSDLITKTMGKLSAAGFNDQLPDALVRVHPTLSLLVEGYQHLLAFGYIIPKPVDGWVNAPDHNWFMVTELGYEWAAGIDPIPEDQQGY